jgi:hypothetical protein
MFIVVSTMPRERHVTHVQKSARLTDVLAELPHERNAELADLIIRLALRVEVGTTLATAHVKTGQSILKNLLEAQEFEDGKVDGRV